MKEGEACRRAAGASAALGSHPALLGGIPAAQPFPAASGRTAWVLVLFHERTVLMKQEDKNMNKENRWRAAVNLNSDFVIGRHLICMCPT